MGRLVFRLRYLLNALIFGVGFFAPWNRWFHMDTVRSAWVYLAYAMQKQGWMNFFSASVTLLVIGGIFALLGALLRTWGVAYLGAATVHSSSMHGDAVVADGPYRYLRNPLYLGVILHTVALAMLMPPTGALFSLLAEILLHAALISSEETFLEKTLGEPYKAYCEKVPALLPALRPQVPAAGVLPNWGLAVAAEIYFWGVFLTFAGVGWKFNGGLMLQGVLISLGISLVVRAMLPKRVDENVPRGTVAI